MARALLIALCLGLGAVALVSADSREPGEPVRAARDDGGGPPEAPVRDCGDRITGAFTVRGDVETPYRFAVRPRRDTVVGPVSFSGAADAGRPAEWRWFVREDQWLKSIALVRPRARVTLVVPREQRAWMRMEYAHGGDRGAHALTLEGCRRRLAPFGGGFTIDYARAPAQGRCAELVVWVAGHEEPLRERLFRPGPGTCRGA